MPNTRHPRFGSLQFWPRKRAKKTYAKLGNFSGRNGPGLEGFSGYKVGMTHLTYIDNYKKSRTKGEEVTVPVTILECPPLKIFSARFYKKTPYGLKLTKEIKASNPDKDLSRKVVLSKKKLPAPSFEDINLGDYEKIRVVLYSQPSKTSINKKKPELFEMDLGGTNEDKLNFIKENMDKEITLDSVFQEGQYVDTHAITKGKGFQGTTKRFGTSIRPRKTEKSLRGAANVGAWTPAKVSFNIPMPGKMGYNQRTQYGLRILKISENAKDITPNGGFLSYGNLKNGYVLVKGSVTGPKKRMVIFNHATRTDVKINELPSIEHISIDSKQGK